MSEIVNENVMSLKERLHQGPVSFEYRKVDGTVRKANGTLSQDLLPKVEPERIMFPMAAIDALMEAKSIPSLDEYASENGLVYVGCGCDEKEGLMYVFEVARKSRHKEGYVTYFDLDKNEFRTFLEENYIGIVE